MLKPARSVSRRQFIKRSALAAAALSLPRFSLGQAGPSANSKLNVACIGVGNRGFFAVSELLAAPWVNIVALCDVDRQLVAKTLQLAARLPGERGVRAAQLGAAPLFSDYREMFASMGAKIDAVTVSTPDHHHYPAAMLAIREGKHVYVEKPLAHTVGEARALRVAARRKGIVSQMGNQGRTTDGIRLIREWTQAGILGAVNEVHAWSPGFPDRYFRRPTSFPIPAQATPAGLDWDNWLGPANAEPYSELLAPERWRGFWKYGSGMLGDWACHTLDGPWWALDLGAPCSVEAKVPQVDEHITPESAEVAYTFPARAGRSAVTLRWWEGNGHRPPTPARWEDDPLKPGLPVRGMFMLGEKNTLFAPNGRPDAPRLLGAKAREELARTPVAPSIPRVEGGPVQEWLRAIAGAGPMPGSNFEYSARLTEMVLLGVVAVRTGRRLEWDSDAGRITNDPSLNAFLDTTAREGWRF